MSKLINAGFPLFSVSTLYYDIAPDEIDHTTGGHVMLSYVQSDCTILQTLQDPSPPPLPSTVHRMFKIVRHVYYL